MLFSWWITILLTVLPPLLRFLLNLIDRDKKLGLKDSTKMNKILWYMDQISNIANQVGCVQGGITDMEDFSSNKEEHPIGHVSQEADGYVGD